MKKILLALFVTAFAISGFAIDLAVSPSSVSWNDQQFAEFSISNLAVGAQVELAAYLDLDGNGVLDAGEPLAAQFELEDGFTNALGAATFVDDNDGSANGAIAGSISFYGNSYLHTIGDYVWKATELDGLGTPVASDSVAFSVTQAASPILITGEVRDYLTSNTVAGAYVELEYFSGVTGVSPATWVDENGEFSIYLPSGVSSNEALGVYAEAAGYVSAPQTPDGDPVSLALFTNGLIAGTNNLSRPLFVTSPIYDLVGITGTVYQVDSSETNVLPGAIVEIEYPSYGEEDNDDDITSFDISDTNGNFTLVFSQSEDQWDNVMITCVNPLLNLRGLVSAPITTLIEGPTNGIALYCHPAESLVSGTVSDLDTTDPIVGMEVDLTSGNDLVGSAYTLSNGTYEIGAAAGTCNAQCDSDSLAQQHYVYNNANGNRYIENLVPDEVRNGQDLAYAQGHLVSGHVYSEGGVPIAGGDAILVQPSEDDWEYRVASTTVAFDGHYDLLAAPGIWNVRTENADNGFWIDLYYTNVLPFSLDMPTPIVVSNADVGGIDFYLEEGTRLQGVVQTPDHQAAGDVQMSAFALNGSGELEYVGGSRTGWDIGEFSFVVPAGSPVLLRADSDGWQTPDTWYGDTGSQDLSSPIVPTIGTVQSNLDIQILAGYQIAVMAYDQFDMASIQNLEITAFDSASNRYGRAIDQWGAWNIFVPTNVPLAIFAGGPGYEGEFMTNTYHLADATYFQRPANTTLSLDFVLYSSSRDSDGDGLPDYVEDSTPNGITEPLPFDISNPELADSDMDGADDYQEYHAGTDAWDPNSIFKLTQASPTGSGLQLRWNSIPGREYTVQVSPDLVGGGWSNIHTIVATGTKTTYTPPTSSTNSYYQVQVSAP